MIGVQDPNVKSTDDTSKKPLLVLQLEEAAVATSGHYRRGYSFADEHISHIVDPNSGKGGDALSSVTIIAPTATEADALATAVSVMGREKGLTLIESLAGVEAIMITPGPGFEIVFSKNARKYIK